jgi:cbb3-type cytochrome oxidase maturation protein
VESLFILIPLSVLAVVVAVLVFFRMNRDGQFDDDQGPAMSILLDDDRPVQEEPGSQHAREPDKPAE